MENPLFYLVFHQGKPPYVIMFSNDVPWGFPTKTQPVIFESVNLQFRTKKNTTPPATKKADDVRVLQSNDTALYSKILKKIDELTRFAAAEIKEDSAKVSVRCDRDYLVHTMLYEFIFETVSNPNDIFKPTESHRSWVMSKVDYESIFGKEFRSYTGFQTGWCEDVASASVGGGESLIDRMYAKYCMKK